MPVTTVHVVNVGSPADDPTLNLPGTLYVPDPIQWPAPWNCMVAVSAAGFSRKNNSPSQSMLDMAAQGFLCLFSTCRLTNPIPGQTTTGKYHQQTDDVKLAMQFMRSNPGGLGYDVTGWVGAIGGSGSAHHALYMALDGAPGVDKADAAICLSPPTDFSNRGGDVPAPIISTVDTYGNSSDLPTLLAESPVSLDLVNASPIRHYNGDHEAMPLSMLTDFSAAMTAAGAQGYVAITNTGTLGKKHSFAMWSSVRDESIAWLIEQLI